jgi:hypothetical protein
MILIGSKAIKHHYPDFPRTPKDTDYAVGVDERGLYPYIKGMEFLPNPILDELYKPHRFGLEIQDKRYINVSCEQVNYTPQLFDDLIK